MVGFTGRLCAVFIQKKITDISHIMCFLNFEQNISLSLTLTQVLWLPQPNHTLDSRLCLKVCML